jgi:hypothetical protein
MDVMPAIKINTTELIETLKITPPEQNIMLVGQHGIGKSQIVKTFFESDGQTVITFFLGQMSDPGDLIGLMHKNEATGQSEFLPPFWWPITDEPVVLFLDELNRARPEILQSVMDLTLNRTLAGKSLPEGSRVISAVNEGEEYQVTDLDPALVSRFNIYQFAPTVEDWLVWANKNDIDERVLTFIQENSEFLDGDPKTGAADAQSFGTDLSRTPDRRSWERVSKTITDIKKITRSHVKMLSGIIGVNAAMTFAKSIRDSHVISADDVLLRFAKTKAAIKKLKTHELAALNDRLVLRVEKGGFTAAAKKKVLTSFLAYVELLIEQNESESCAHLASLLDRPRFEKASLFLLGDANILAAMVDFIQEIAID